MIENEKIKVKMLTLIAALGVAVVGVANAYAPEFNCSAPRGLPCPEAYALQDVIEGLKLPNKPEFSRTYCSVMTDSIRITCSCNIIASDNITVCHVTDIYTEVVDLSSGIIHENLSKLTYLESLNLGSNRLHGTIPASLGSLKFLKSLVLHNNFLKGPIPPSFGNLESLEDLRASRNLLSGEIPKELGNLTHLVEINLGENQLTGNLPKELGNLINLQSLEVGSNYLDGVLDENFINLASIETFDVGGNNISGPIPTFISKWSNLTNLNLIGNNFEGNLPVELFKVPKLVYLKVSDLKSNEDFVFPEQANLPNINTLILRNCNIAGHIPQVIGNWPGLYTLDLSFNKLNGSIPNALENVSVIILTGNMLEGPIPAWLTEKTDLTEFSYNNLEIPNSTHGKHHITAPNILPTRNDTAAAEAKAKHCNSLNYNLFINCGGGKDTYEGNEYEQDTSLEKFYKTKRWAYSCSGNFLSDSGNASDYIKNKTCGVSDQGLQETARLCPVSLTYYGFCLHNGNYSVKLQFAELLFANEEDYSSRAKRIFDVYIQGEKRLEDFNIKNESGEAYKATTREFVANVRENQLVIQFYWAGKGSLSNAPQLNGPLVSAIAVSPNFTIGHKNLSAGQVTGIAVGSVVAPILLLAFLWKMGWLGNNELKKVKIQVEGKSYTLQQIINATRRFSPATETGRGRFGIVYKAEFPNDKIKLAVKRISPDLMQDTIKTELQGEIYNLKSLKHDNLIKLYDGYSKKDLHLLIYEYLEKGSLHQAVLDPNPKELLDWKQRFDICLGLANALKYLHEPGLMILHRNIKASNILLDGSNNAKLTDFGWARLYDEEDPFVTFKAGTARVYMAPEYALRKKITVKADVYSYGVVVLEVFSGRPSIQDKPNQESAYLLDDARTVHAQKRMDKLVDPKMVNYNRKVVYTAMNLAIMCLHPTANLRPTMSEVVSVLLEEKSLDEITKAHISEAGDSSKSENQIV